MSFRFKVLGLGAALSLLGMASANVALADSTSTPVAENAKPTVPLPQDAQNANSANPASPNCYPDINHCASYASGNMTKANPLQQKPAQPAAQQGKKSQ